MMRRGEPLSQLVSGLRLRILRPWVHPLATIRRLRFRLRWRRSFPTPEQVDQMTVREIETYVRDTGFDARIRKAVAESNSRGVPANPDDGLRVGSDGAEV